MGAYLSNGYILDPKKREIIIKFHQENEPPYLINQLSQKFGVERVYSTDMPYNISGWVKKSGEGKYEIALNNKENFRRKRFTAAHELAHLLLHEEFIGDGIQDDALYRSKLSSDKEVQANKLAADILMPYRKVYDFLGVGAKMIELPSIFEVSHLAMCIRLGVSDVALANS